MGPEADVLLVACLEDKLGAACDETMAVAAKSTEAFICMLAKSVEESGKVSG